MAKRDTHCSDKCCGSDVKAEDCTCPPTCKHCNCNAKNVSEGLADMADIAERDHEVQMARAELYKIAKYAIKLHDMLKGVSEAEGIEGWMQSKITKAADYVGSVYHTLDYDMATESKKVYKSTLTNEDVTEYKASLKERMSQKKSELTELGPDTLYKYWNKSYDDVSDPDGKDPEKLKKRRAFMKKAAAQHNKKKGWERPQGVKKSAGDASKSAAALAKHLAKKDMRTDEYTAQQRIQAAKDKAAADNAEADALAARNRKEKEIAKLIKTGDDRKLHTAKVDAERSKLRKSRIQ